MANPNSFDNEKQKLKKTWNRTFDTDSKINKSIKKIDINLTSVHFGKTINIIPLFSGVVDNDGFLGS